MDVDRLARRVSEQLAARPSRRGIVSAVGKLAAGAGVVLSGLRHPSGASAEYCPVAGSCCSGSCSASQDACDGLSKCPGGYKKRYQWFCTYTDPATGGRTRQLCLDCFNGQRHYACTVVTTR
jgi:hypothetical protein